MWDKPVPQSLKLYFRAPMATLLAMVVIFGCVGASSELLAQDSSSPAPTLQPVGGLRVRTVSVFSDYDSKTLPASGFQPGAVGLSGDASGGGSVLFEWMKSTERSTFSLTYTPSYIGHVRYSELNAFNHALSFNVNRKLAPRWAFSFSVAGNLSSVEQSLFAPTTLSNVASVPSTFDDLAAGILSSKFTNNPQLGSVLNGAPLVESPLSNLLYGRRMFTSSATASLSYSYSPRLSVTFSGGGGRTQHVSDGQAPASATNNYLLADTTSGTASVAISYSLSPSTQFSGSVTTNRISSFQQDAYTTTPLVTLGRTFGRRWLLQAHGGVGVISPLRQTFFVISTKPRPAVGGSLGFKTSSHTLLGAYDRTVSDSYGLGAATSSSANASWRWGGPGRSWWIESSAGWQRLEGNALTNTSGWHASAGFGRSVGTHLAVLTQYTYLYYSGLLQTSAYSLSQSAVRLTLTWSSRPNTLR